jgi:hypothetical protein
MEFTNHGKRWIPEEEEELKKLYNEDKLDIIEISKKMKRYPYGLISRLISLKIINFDKDVRGFDKEEFEKLKKTSISSTSASTSTSTSLPKTKTNIIEFMEIIIKELKEIRQEIKNLKEDIEEIKELSDGSLTILERINNKNDIN